MKRVPLLAALAAVALLAGCGGGGSTPENEAEQALATLGDDRLRPKEVVVFVERRGESVAVARTILRRRGELEVDLAGGRLVLRFRGGAVEVLEDGRPVPFSEPFWFAVAAFSPDVRVLR